jgi:ParB-like nuclease domain
MDECCKNHPEIRAVTDEEGNSLGVCPPCWIAANELKIDQEFKDLIPRISEKHLEELERSIKAEGCRDPLLIWEGIIIDGHNRYEICRRNAIPYKVIEHPFETRDAAKMWIVTNQLARRNLTPQQASYLRGVRFLLEKRKAGGHGSRFSPFGETAEKIARATGVSKQTVQRDAQFARAVNSLPPGKRAEVLAGPKYGTQQLIDDSGVVRRRGGAKHSPTTDPAFRNFRRMKYFWNQSSDQEKEAFKKWAGLRVAD